MEEIGNVEYDLSKEPSTSFEARYTHTKDEYYVANLVLTMQASTKSIAIDVSINKKKLGSSQIAIDHTNPGNRRQSWESHDEI